MKLGQIKSLTQAKGFDYPDPTLPTRLLYTE